MKSEYCAKVFNSTRVNKKVHFLEFYWPGHPLMLPGQYLTLEPRFLGSVMPRPFSIFRVKPDYVSILFQITGRNTAIYAGLNNGEQIRISGPGGNGIIVDEKYGRIILVAGGIGLAPLTFLAEILKAQGREVLFLLGFHKYVFGINILERCGYKVQTITQFGAGRTGLVTDLLKQELDSDQGESLVVACGPILMLKEVYKLTAGRNDTKVLWEEVMACNRCGCKGCAVPVFERDYAHTCKDGPAFDAGTIDWSRVPQKKIYFFPESKRKERVEANNPLGVVLTGQSGQKLELEYPIGNASGCLDMDEIEAGQVDISGFGMLECKGMTLESRPGNPPPRVWETFGGMLNSIGLQNDGLKIFLKHKLPRWLALNKPLAANIAGRTPEEYAEISVSLQDSGISLINLNVSCPNTNEEIIGKYPDLIAAVVAAVRKEAKEILLYVKLPPMVSDIVACGMAAINAGADGLTLINTLEGMDIDIETLLPVLGGVYGGLSGPAIFPVGLKIVDVCYRAGLKPIIGAGGIGDIATAIKYFVAGASFIQIGTALFANPRSSTNVNRELSEYMVKKNIPSILDLAGLRHRINQ